MKFCFVKFSPVEEIASKFASADFRNFYQLASKTSAESVVFFGLEGTLTTSDLKSCLDLQWLFLIIGWKAAKSQSTIEKIQSFH